MNDFLKAIGKEWERNLLLGIAVVIACIGGYYAYKYLNAEEEEETERKKKPELPYYYEVARLDGVSVPNLPSGINPMSCEFVKPEPPPPPPKPPWKQPPKTEPGKAEPPKPTPQKTEPPKPTPQKTEPGKTEPPKPTPQKTEPPKPTPQKTEPGKVEPVKPTPPKPKPTPPKPPRVVELRYVGNMSIDGGDSAAQLYVSEIISKKQKNTFKARLRIGEKILGGLLEIKSFDKNRVVVVHSGDKEVKVPIRQKKPTTISIPQ
ncbi:MAG: hypothetical protein J6X55_15650 [Victivallales bacterium]|nr:hypothetical protein [Victivallales bacterium]